MSLLLYTVLNSSSLKQDWDENQLILAEIVEIWEISCFSPFYIEFNWKSLCSDRTRQDVDDIKRQNNQFIWKINVGLMISCNVYMLRLSRQSMFSIFSIFQEFKNISWLKFFRIKRSFSVSWTLYKHKQSCDGLLVMFVAIKQQDHQGYLNTEPDCNFCVWQLLLDRREGSSSGQHEHLQKKPTLGIFLNYSGSAPQLWTSVSLTGWNRLKAAV